jgi:pyruvate formate-lyase activating enzyme-like uncharacterized protein
MLSEDNIKTVVRYIMAIRIEINFSTNYRKDIIELLTRFARYHHNNNKLFKDATRDDVIAFLDSHRKTETQDPMHKWIGTYNIYRVHLIRFFGGFMHQR